MIKVYEDICNEFVSILEKNVSYNDLDIFFNNGDSLIINSMFDSSNSKDYASYDIINNQINVYTNDSSILRTAIGHELLHMCSTKHISNNVNCGFSIYSKTKDKFFGESFNEGYTQLLTNRFYDFHDRNIYEFQMIMASRIELIVGKEKMMSYYFNADLNSLIDELRKYNSKENINNFFKAMDYLLLLERFINDSGFESDFEVIKSDLKDGVDYCQNFIEETIDNIIINRLVSAEKLTHIINTIALEDSKVRRIRK